MRPEHYVFLRHDEMPRLASGKVNLNALHAISNERAQPKVVQQSAVKDEMTPLEVIMQAMRETFPQAASNGTLTPTADFFCDLGGHSLVAAVLVSRIRKMARVPLKTIGLGDVYSMRTAQALADYYPEVSVKTSLETSSEESVVIPSTHRPVSRARYTVCAIAQLPALALLAFINGLGLLTPYFVFDLVDLKHGTGWAILAAYATFVILPVFTAVVGIIGKWAVLGRAKEGRYPLYGLYYYRWWLAGRLTDLIEPAMVADSPLYSRLLRVLGAQIGTNGHFSAMPNEPCLDLISIGDDVVIGKDVVLTASIIEGGELVLQRITIGNRVNVGAHCVLEGGSRMEDGSKLESLSMLPAFTTVPAGAMWGGSPARFTGSAPVPSPEVAARPSRLHRFAFGFACALLSTFVIPLLYLAPQVPGLLMFVVVSLKKEGLSRWAQMGLLALPASVAYIVCVFLELVIARRLILGRMRPGTHRLLSFYMLRKWLVDRLMDLSLIVLHPVHATLYVVPYLRALGVQIGHGAEVSNIRGLNFELTEIGDQSFLADNVLVGEAVIEGNSITYEKTKLEARAFAGNSALLPQGITLPSNSLVGVLSLAPRDLAPGQSSFGSPPIRMPKRPLASANHPDHLLFRPGAKRVALRLFIEGTRIWLPRFIIIVALAFGLEIFKKMRHDVGHYWVWVMLPVFDFCLFSAPAIIITVTLKWILVGGYVPSEWPLWSVEVWLSEFVTSLYESLLAPILLRHLVGTPFLNMILRMMGADIGSMCTLLSHDMTEWDMVSMGDEAVLNLHAGPQTHLFEDRVMRVNKVTLARRSVMKPYAICLPDSNLGEESELGSLSLVMRGEAVPPMEKWNGIPIRRKT
jgi:non-ribosomal peptide synthetase-like protein